MSPEGLSHLEDPESLEELPLKIPQAQMAQPYYKTFIEILQLQPLNSLSSSPSLPHDFLRVLLSVIHKVGKDPSQCASYRPISLFNVYIKLFTEVLT